MSQWALVDPSPGRTDAVSGRGIETHHPKPRTQGPSESLYRAEGVNSHFSGRPMGDVVTGCETIHRHLELRNHTEISQGKRGKGWEVLIASSPAGSWKGLPGEALPGPTSCK